jgi:hypothetical protein
MEMGLGFLPPQYPALFPVDIRTFGRPSPWAHGPIVLSPQRWPKWRISGTLRGCGHGENASLEAPAPGYSALRGLV